MDFKNGATFSVALVLDVVVEGSAVTDLTGWTGDCDLVFMNKTRRDLTFSWIDATARIARVAFDGDTTDWPLGTSSIDIILSGPGGLPKIITPTFVFTVTPKITLVTP